jgi:beta-glucanase (GH16 family)
MLVQEASLDQFHEYSVEWDEKHIVFRLDGAEIYRSPDPHDQFPEPLFAILNFAKINDSPMTGRDWVMEIDWVKHEALQ